MIVITLNKKSRKLLNMLESEESLEFLKSNSMQLNYMGHTCDGWNPGQLAPHNEIRLCTQVNRNRRKWETYRNKRLSAAVEHDLHTDLINDSTDPKWALRSRLTWFWLNFYAKLWWKSCLSP